MSHSYLWQSYDKYTNKGVLQNWYIWSQPKHQRTIIFWWPHVTIIILLWMFHEQYLLKIKICKVRFKIMYSTKFTTCNNFKIWVLQGSWKMFLNGNSIFNGHISTSRNTVMCSCSFYAISYAMKVKNINCVNTLHKHESATEITCNKWHERHCPHKILQNWLILHFTLQMCGYIHVMHIGWLEEQSHAFAL